MDCVLEVPLNQKCTATSCEISIGDRIFETLVISREEASEYQRSNSRGGDGDGDYDYQKYNPDYFFLPFEGVKPGEVATINFCYFESLMFVDGGYRVKLPLTFRPETLPSTNFHDFFKLSCVINTATTSSQWGSSSHKLICLEQSDVRIEVKSDPDYSWDNHDFDISYTLWHSTILCSVIDKPPTAEEKGTFSLFLTPPELGTYGVFGRRIILIMDKSGSMQGTPIESAKNALALAIQNLQSIDFFTVIAFSEHQYYYSQSLVPATLLNKEAAIAWTQNIQAAGLTDILTPLRSAVSILEESNLLSATKGTVPFIFLITDGAVRNERDICLYVKLLQANVRINTFGIGLFCNHFFLKMLAQIGRGFCEVAYKSTDVFDQMVYLLGMTNAPVLTDVRIGIAKSAENVEVFPYPIPDLFCGAPLVVSGKYTGTFPSKISLLGLLTNGEKFKTDVPVDSKSKIPVDRIFVKQQLDILTAQAWLTDSRRIKQQVIDISMKESMPCAHTTMVAFEIDKNKKKDFDKKKLRDKRIRRGLLLAVGGLVVLGVAAFAFGDVFSTMGNVPIGDVGGLGGQGCDCCGGQGGGDCSHCCGAGGGGGDCCQGGGGDCCQGGGGDCQGCDCHC